MKTVLNPNALQLEWQRQYERLAKHFAALLPRCDVLVEIGCGKGQLTLPLAKRLAKYKLIAVDNYGPQYSAWQRKFKSYLVPARLKGRIRLFVSDYLDWLSKEVPGDYGAVISSEFLPDIDSRELPIFLSQCFRVLKPGGITIHAFLSPVPKNARQRLLIAADSDPRWSKFPPKEWFSPHPRLVVDELKRAGFQTVRRVHLNIDLRVKAAAAQSLLSSWDVKPSFWKFYQTRLIRHGLDIPDWVMVSGVKPS